MNRRKFITAASASLVLAKKVFAQTPTVIPNGIMTAVTTRAFDNNRSGCNLNEKILTQASVKANGVKKLFSLYMEGDARGTEAQPLFVPSVAMDDGMIRDIVIVTSMNNTVWCYDANTSDILWVKKVGVPVNGGASIDAWQVNDHWGLLSTGVIDIATNIWYGVSWTAANGMPASGMHYVHGLNIKDGSRAFPPVSLATLQYTTADGVLQTYKSMMRKQRCSLVMTNVNGVKTIFFCCGTVLETTNGAAGWIIAFDVATATISAAMTTTAGDGAGVWMAGQGLCADDNGFLYGMTGNGSFDGVQNFGECIFKVQYTPLPSAKLAIVDWWAPYTDSGRVGGPVTAHDAPEKLPAKLAGVNAPTSMGHMPSNMVSDRRMGMVTPQSGDYMVNHIQKVNPDAGYSDEDLGSAGLSLIPEYNLALGAGKDGIAYIVKMNNMGQTQPNDFTNAAANYGKLAAPPSWYTYFPGYNVSPAPQDPTTLDFLYDGKTRHMHSTSIRFLSSIHGMMLFCWGENSPLRAWSISPTGVLTFLAQSAEIASVNVTASPGGMPGGFGCLSSNGNLPGTALLWYSIPYGDANKTVTNGRLLCYDPENFTQKNADGTPQISVLWDSQAAGITYMHNKFDTPVVNGGKIFLPTYEDEVLVLG